jgi:fumarate reductase subunit D
MRKIISFFTWAIYLLLPMITLAEGTTQSGITAPNVAGLPSGNFAPILDKVLTFVTSLIGGLALLMIIVSGIMYMTSGGDSGKADKAKEWLTASIIGLVIALLAYVIVIVVAKTLGASW